MVSLDAFQARLLTDAVEDLVDDLFFNSESQHINGDAKHKITSEFADTYRLQPADARLYVTGSAHLGFSLVEKSHEMPRYRLFSADSDIDCAIVSARLFTQLWDEIAKHAHQQSPWPNPMNGLGTYMIYGWLRPDKFPRGLFYCDRWWPLFSDLSRRRVAGYHRVSGALFYSTAHLKRYLARAVSECQTLEKMK